jgi:hypothetical protein
MLVAGLEKDNRGLQTISLPPYQRDADLAELDVDDNTAFSHFSRIFHPMITVVE